MGPSFEVVFTEKNTYGSHEQCMRPSCWTQTPDAMSLDRNPNSHVVWKIKIDYNINNTIIEFVEEQNLGTVR